MTLLQRFAALALSVFLLPACAGHYSGPVEVTRFVAENEAALGQGQIAVTFAEDMSNLRARDAFARAVGEQLAMLGYEVVDESGAATQVALVRTSRDTIATSRRARSPVSVGVGGSTGSYGSGVGVGLGINLGGASRGPDVVSRLSVRISDNEGNSLWEGRAEHPVAFKSPDADIDASARILASALFRDFPGGNGEVVTLSVDELSD
ncbi:hypothetical protein [Qipengyuania nanhaisediminis]|uniref:hypothetical protein n=1 Tax=Qipengyuania nanhaisediminis TaxID=604088 RepID=UPI0038B305B7